MKNYTTYRILIKSNNKYYKLGTIIIKRFKGDILYTPSQSHVINANTNIIKKNVEHFSWHSSGRVHVKTKDSNYEIFEEGIGVLNQLSAFKKDRQKIEDIGFQEILKDTVIDITTLPEHKKKIDKLDVVLDIKEYIGPIQFYFSIVSGTHIVESYNGGNTPVKINTKSSDLILDLNRRCLGWESGNGDKLLQYGLYKYIGDDLKKGRRLFIATDSKITKIK